MAIKINGTTVIDNSRNLTSIEAATFTGTGYVKVPSGTDAQRPVSPVAGMFRYNTTSNTFEGYVSGAWGPIGGGGGATGGGTAPNKDDIFYENSKTVNYSYTISTNKNAMTTGPVVIADTATVTIPDGSRWVIL